MAIKDNTKKSSKTGKLLEFLNKDYKAENYILLVISLIALAMSVMILMGELVPYEGFPIIGEYPKVFATVLLIISLIGLLIVVTPFFQSIYPELKKITWSDWKTFIDNSVKVFLFIIILSLFFLGCDGLIVEIIQRISGR